MDVSEERIPTHDLDPGHPLPPRRFVDPILVAEDVDSLEQSVQQEEVAADDPFLGWNGRHLGLHRRIGPPKVIYELGDFRTIAQGPHDVRVIVQYALGGVDLDRLGLAAVLDYDAD